MPRLIGERCAGEPPAAIAIATIDRTVSIVPARTRMRVSMQPGSERSPAGWPLMLLLGFARARARQTERSTASSALGARSRGGLDVEAGAAAGERLTCRRVRDRSRLLLEPAVELVALCRARTRV